MKIKIIKAELFSSAEKEKIMRKFIVTTLLLTFLVSCCALWGCADTEPDNYKIKFVNYDDTVLYETEVVSSGAVSYGGETPTKPSDAEYSYTFAGWADEDGIVVADFPAATKDATYKATFNQAKRSYTATFVVDGNTVKTATFKYGTVITYDGETPTKDEDAQYVYTFKGWKIGETVYETELPAITGDVTLTAEFATTKKTYKVTWVNGTGQEATEVEYGSAPEYKGAAPTKADDDDYSYTFVGWAKTSDGEVVDLTQETVVENTSYFAVYTSTRIRFIVKWNNEGREGSTYVRINEAPVYQGETPTKAPTNESEFVFKGWAKTQGGAVVDLANETIIEDTTYYAVFEGTTRYYTITFVVDGVKEIKKFEYNATPDYGKTPEKAATEIAEYVFKGWATTEGGEVLSELPAVTVSTTYYAVFTENRLLYSITWVVNGVTKTTLVQKNAIPAYEDGTPTKPEDDYVYTFKGWATSEDGEVLEQLPEVTDDATYYAVFDQKKVQYTLTIVYQLEDGSKAADNKEVLIDKNAIYGKTETQSPEIDGYLPDMFWLAGRMTENTTVTVTYKAADVWDGTSVAEGYESGTGTAEDPYIIKTAAQLKYMQTQYSGATSQQYAKGLYFKLAASLDMSSGTWTPIANRGSTTTNKGWSYFAGNFDGNGYTIKIVAGDNKYLAAGLFEGVSGTVKNLVMAGSVTGASRAGSLGYMATTGCNIENVISFATIKAGGYAGGLFGAVNGVGTVTNCANYGEVSATSTYCAGIIANFTKAFTVTNCVNYGKITSTSNGVGGIVGGETKAVVATYTDCANYGIVTGVTKVGGIVGETYASNVSNCNNYGEVYASGQYCGGIVGSTTTTTITDCENYGVVGITDGVEGSSTNRGFGGIVGWTTSNSQISSCANYGDINGYTNVGGISGYLGAGSSVSDDCTNSGNISAHDNKGDIIGYDANTAA